MNKLKKIGKALKIDIEEPEEEKKDRKGLPVRLAWILLLVNGGFRLIPCIAHFLFFHSVANSGALISTGALMLAGATMSLAFRLEKSDLVAGFLLLFSIALDIIIYSPLLPWALISNPWALISVLSLLAIGIATSIKEPVPSVSARQRRVYEK